MSQVQHMHTKVLLGEKLPEDFWYWSYDEYQALRYMVKQGWKLWDIAKELDKPMNYVGAAIYLLDMEGRLEIGRIC